MKNKSLMVVPIAALLAAVYWWQTVLAVLLGMVKLVFGMILYNLLRVVIVAALLLFVVRYGGYWLWRKLTGGKRNLFGSGHAHRTLFKHFLFVTDQRQSGTRERTGIRDGDAGSTTGLDRPGFQPRTGSNAKKPEEGSARRRMSRSVQGP